MLCFFFLHTCSFSDFILHHTTFPAQVIPFLPFPFPSFPFPSLSFSLSSLPFSFLYTCLLHLYVTGFLLHFFFLLRTSSYYTSSSDNCFPSLSVPSPPLLSTHAYFIYNYATVFFYILSPFLTPYFIMLLFLQREVR